MSAAPSFAYGLTEVADGVFAWLQPDGGWGRSNAGLVRGEGSSLLVDTLFDLHLTAAMLAGLEPVTATAPIEVVVNTHANGDHCYGNQLLDGARIIASAAAAEEMDAVPPSSLAAMTGADLGPELSAFVAHAFAAFDFEGIEVVAPTETFTGETEVSVGGRPVTLREVGPAHTVGDVVVEVPAADAGGGGVIFTGDICFIGSTPIVWAGPIDGWLAALDEIIARDPGVVVPGHGPVTGTDGVAGVAGYLRFVQGEAARTHAAGLSVEDAAAEIDLDAYRDWVDPERIIINLDAAYADLDADHQRFATMDAFAAMARWHTRRAGSLTQPQPHPPETEL